jgi:hypothetical protein
MLRSLSLSPKQITRLEAEFLFEQLHGAALAAGVVVDIDPAQAPVLDGRAHVGHELRLVADQICHGADGVSGPDGADVGDVGVGGQLADREAPAGRAPSGESS